MLCMPGVCLRHDCWAAERPHDRLTHVVRMQDILIDELGGPSKVAEMSGRRKRMIRNPSGPGFVYRLVAEDGVPLDQVCPKMPMQ